MVLLSVDPTEVTTVRFTSYKPTWLSGGNRSNTLSPNGSGKSQPRINGLMITLSDARVSADRHRRARVPRRRSLMERRDGLERQGRLSG